MKFGALTALAMTLGIGPTASAQEAFLDGPRNYLAFSAGYSERYKESVGAEVVATDLFQTGTDLRVGAQFNDLGHQWTADINRTGPAKVTVFGAAADLTIGVSGRDFAWDDALYQTDRLAFYAALGFAPSPRARLKIKAEIYRDTISDVGANTSPLIAAETGRVTGSGLSLVYSAGNLGRRSGRGGFVQLDGYGLTGDASWVGLSGGYEANVPLGQTFIARFLTRGGVAKGVGSYDLRVTDRAFLEASQLRGFAYGGVGPVDTDGTVVTPLGGQKYATTSLEVGREVFTNSRTAVFVSAFYDVGAVWDLPDAQGGFGPVDDSRIWRQSAGIAVDLDTSFGVMSLSYGKPLVHEPLDRIQEFALSFKIGF